jgi:hypothetical protein
LYNDNTIDGQLERTTDDELQRRASENEVEELESIAQEL